MSNIILHLNNASSHVRTALSKLSSAGGNNNLNNTDTAGEDHVHDEGSASYDRPNLPAAAQAIDDRIEGFEDQQIALIAKKERIARRLLSATSPDEIQIINAELAAIDTEIAAIDGQIAGEKNLLDNEFVNIHNETITDLETRLASIPTHPTMAAARLELREEIRLRNELFAAGIDEPYMLDNLVDMSDSSDEAVRNTVDRVLDGDVTVHTFGDIEAPLSEALAKDPTFNPETQVALYRPPNDEIRIYSGSAGGFFTEDGNVLIRDDQGSLLFVHEVNHALNEDGNSDFVGDHTGTDRRAIESFTTEVRAYDLDNRYADEAETTVNNLQSAPAGSDPETVILNELGYDPANLTGNQVHVATQVSEIADGLPEDLTNITTEQQAQIERLFIADLVLVDSDLYGTASDAYSNSESVRDTLNQIVTEGPGGNTDNSANKSWVDIIKNWPWWGNNTPG